jgi:hypothetical protein
MSRSLLSQFSNRSHAAAENPPRASSAPLRDLRESVLILIVKAHSGANRNLLLLDLDVAAGFRRLFAEAQQTAPSKLPNTLKYMKVFSFASRRPLTTIRIWREGPLK